MTPTPRFASDRVDVDRAQADQPIGFAVGCDQLAKPCTNHRRCDVLARIHARTQTAAEEAAHTLLDGVVIE